MANLINAMVWEHLVVYALVAVCASYSIFSVLPHAWRSRLRAQLTVFGVPPKGANTLLNTNAAQSSGCASGCAGCGAKTAAAPQTIHWINASPRQH